MPAPPSRPLPEPRSLHPLRSPLGLADNATVISRADPERGVLELMAADRLEPHLDELFDTHRREALSGATASSGERRPRTGLVSRVLGYHGRRRETCRTGRWP
jgi:hypothetical protein